MGNKPIPRKLKMLCDLPQDKDEIYYHLRIHFDKLLDTPDIQPADFWIGNNTCNQKAPKHKKILKTYDWVPNTAIRKPNKKVTVHTFCAINEAPDIMDQGIGVCVLPGMKAYLKLHFNATTGYVETPVFASYSTDKELVTNIATDLALGYEVLILENNKQRILFNEHHHHRKPKLENLRALAQLTNPKRRRDDDTIDQEEKRESISSEKKNNTTQAQDDDDLDSETTECSTDIPDDRTTESTTTNDEFEDEEEEEEECTDDDLDKADDYIIMDSENVSICLK